MAFITQASAFLEKNMIVVLVIALVGMVTWDMCRRRSRSPFESFSTQSEEEVLNQAAGILSKMVAAQKLKPKGGVTMKPVVTDKGVVVVKPVVNNKGTVTLKPIVTNKGVVTMKPVVTKKGGVTMKPVVVTNKGVVTMKPVVTKKGGVTMKPVAKKGGVTVKPTKAAGNKGGKGKKK